MSLLSQYGLGAILVSEDYNILEINEIGDRLLHDDGLLTGKSLMSVVPLFCQPEYTSEYFNIDFGEYLAQCPTPEMEDLPPDTRLIVFRDATNDAYLNMLMNVVNQISEAIILCDEHERILIFNDAAVKLDSLLLQVESLLFGTEKGAYTGAERKAGLFEQANHGTLLLDEINSMNISLLAKFFILNFNRKLLKNVREIDTKVLTIFNSYEWPGNVRELQHAIEYAMNIMSEDASVITIEYLLEHILCSQNQEVPIHLTDKNDPSLENTLNNMNTVYFVIIEGKLR